MEDNLPEGNMIMKILNEVPVPLFGLWLFDSGSTSMLINKRAVLHQIQALIGCDQQVTTTQGIYSSKEYSNATEITLPNFCKSCHIPYVHLHMFHSPSI